MAEPSSRLQAVVAGWEFPASREWLVFADLYDLQMAKASKRKPKPYPRPFDKSKTRIGGTKKIRRTQDELRALLALPRVAKP
jgi:hypothetical protein